jgi:hypothetical protein
MSKIKSLSGFQVVPGPQTKEADALHVWASELRPSMRKLRQGMDSLCKTARLGNERNFPLNSFYALAKKELIVFSAHLCLLDSIL